jgi:isoleucyl-tRNA synthetase
VPQKSHLNLTPAAIRKAARKTAEEAIEIQKTEFRALGVMADWDGPNGTYRTMGTPYKNRASLRKRWLIIIQMSDQDYEIRQLRLLQQMVDKGQLACSIQVTPPS